MPNTELLELAARLIREGGLEALTMDSLAEAAGVSRTTVYRQVGSREALLAALEERGIALGERGDVRARILAAAGVVFPRLGLEGATIEAIAEAAEVGSATVYRHFGDKQGLIHAFVEARSPRRAVWQLARAPSGDLHADLLQLSRTVLSHMVENADLLRLAILERARDDSLFKELSRSPDRTMHAVTALLQHYAARGELVAEPPERLARAFLGLLFSAGMFPALLGLPGDCEPQRDAALLVSIFLNGVTVSGPRATKEQTAK